MGFSQEDVKEILSLLDASPFDELQLETEGLKLTVRRSAATAAAAPAIQATAPASTPAPARAPSDPAPASNGSEGTPVTAALLGTFYRAPKPGAPPFVEVGSKVDKDTVIGIIEVMKLMNSVAAGVSGVVTEICAADAQLVEFGQVLLRVRPGA